MVINMKIIVGSRDSKLAVIQSQMVIDAIKKNNDNIQTELLTMKTTGDKILDRTLDKVGGKGLFVKELDKALLDKRADITVHSLKDMPMEINKELPIVAVSEREDPRDVLILPEGIDEPDLSKPVGCSSQRRKIQFEMLYPDAKVIPIRGNVQTRLKKLDNGEFGAIILAYAGIKRLGLEKRVSRIFEVDEILPASCQGILAVQARKDFDKSVLSEFHSESNFIISMAERAFIRHLGGGCGAPSACYAVIENEKICLTGFHVDKAGHAFRDSICGEKENAEKLGIELAQRMKGV